MPNYLKIHTLCIRLISAMDTEDLTQFNFINGSCNIISSRSSGVK